VLFDFDYTLVDSSSGILDCIGYALGGMGLPGVDPDRARRTIGLSLPRTLVALMGAELEPRGEEFARLFGARADEVMNAHTHLLPQVRPALARLAECGAAMGIVSTKYRYRIERFLRDEGLSDAFRLVLGLEDVPAAKPDPAGLLLAVERLGGSPGKAVYVGDSVVDGEAASRAGMPFVAVLSGATTAAEFASHNPEAVLDSVADLPAYLGCSGEGGLNSTRVSGT
jgi:phosphoglycolate phosphatase